MPSLPRPAPGICLPSRIFKIFIIHPQALACPDCQSSRSLTNIKEFFQIRSPDIPPSNRLNISSPLGIGADSAPNRQKPALPLTIYIVNTCQTTTSCIVNNLLIPHEQNRIDRPHPIRQSPRRCACPASHQFAPLQRPLIPPCPPPPPSPSETAPSSSIATRPKHAFAAKTVINGRDTMFFNILPAQIPVGLRPLQDDEEQPLGARGHHHAEGCRAVALR